jgi:glycosyltransferase involved in cell wall biosynthesis
MLISVIIPCYNENKTIDQIIDRILKNEKFKYEIIVIDDFSTDQTKNLVREEIIRDPRIRYLENSDTGMHLNIFISVAHSTTFGICSMLLI